jgi:hypothetical protein
MTNASAPGRRAGHFPGPKSVRCHEWAARRKSAIPTAIQISEAKAPVQMRKDVRGGERQPREEHEDQG